MHFDQNVNSTNRIYFSDINSMIYEQKVKYERTSPLYMIPFTGHMTAAVPAPNDSSNCVLCCVELCCVVLQIVKAIGKKECTEKERERLSQRHR